MVFCALIQPVSVDLWGCHLQAHGVWQACSRQTHYSDRSSLDGCWSLRVNRSRLFPLLGPVVWVLEDGRLICCVTYIGICLSCCFHNVSAHGGLQKMVSHIRGRLLVLPGEGYSSEVHRAGGGQAEGSHKAGRVTSSLVPTTRLDVFVGLLR